jgi:hypothetical protein
MDSKLISVSASEMEKIDFGLCLGDRKRIEFGLCLRRLTNLVWPLEMEQIDFGLCLEDRQQNGKFA